MNPLDAFKEKVDEIKAEVKLAVEIDIVTEAVKVGLSRLATLDPDNAAKYTGMVGQL